MMAPDESAAIDDGAFYRDPARYELITGALSGDGPSTFYRTLALRYGSPVLELAAGTGRIAVPIALAGCETVGLDASREMLRVAADRQFQSIFVASNSFSHLYSRADIEACLGCVRRHLGSSGRFVLQVFNPALGLFVRPPDHRIPVAKYVNSAGTEFTVSKCVRYDSAAQISHETWYFRNEVTGQEDESPIPQNVLPSGNRCASPLQRVLN